MRLIISPIGSFDDFDVTTEIVSSEIVSNEILPTEIVFFVVFVNSEILTFNVNIVDMVTTEDVISDDGS